MQTSKRKTSDLEAKNDFVRDTASYLAASFGTDKYEIVGDNEYEGVIEKSPSGFVCYCSRMRDPNEPKDLLGVKFWKVDCNWTLSEQGIIQKIAEHAKAGKIEVEEKKGNSLVLKFGKTRYLTMAYEGKGYADDISITFFQLPSFDSKL